MNLIRIFAIFKKELIQLMRDRSTFVMIIMLPIVQLFLFGYAINNDPKNLNTTVYMQENGYFPRSILNGFKNTEYFKINKVIYGDQKGRSLLKKGKTKFVITIPQNFSKDLIRGNYNPILIEGDATDPIASQGAIAAANASILSVLEKTQIGAMAKNNRKNINPLISHKAYNPEGFTNYNIIPGLIGVLLAITGIMMTALSITRERERGNMENLLSMPISPAEIMIGKIVPYVCIGYIHAGLILSTAYLLFGIPILGSIYLLMFVIFIFIICNLSIGFAISAMVKNQMQAMQMTIMTFLPSIMLSGFMFPFDGMPNWAQIVGNCFPLTYFLRISRGIILKGCGFQDIVGNLWPLIIFMLIISSITLKFYKKTLD